MIDITVNTCLFSLTVLCTSAFTKSFPSSSSTLTRFFFSSFYSLVPSFLPPSALPSSFLQAVSHSLLSLTVIFILPFLLRSPLIFFRIILCPLTTYRGRPASDHQQVRQHQKRPSLHSVPSPKPMESYKSDKRYLHYMITNFLGLSLKSTSCFSLCRPLLENVPRTTRQPAD